jgi:hypothetical protein
MKLKDTIAGLRAVIKPSALLRPDWVWVFCGSTAIAILGVTFGRQFVKPGPHIHHPDYPLLHGFVRWDATYYRDIASLGYFNRPGQAPVHFMPAYPLLARGIQWATGASIEWAMVLASHACFLAALILLANYTERRYGAAHPAARTGTLLCLGFFPVGMFFHVGYTESMFLLVCAGLISLMDRDFHPVWIATVAAVGLVTRLVGPALCLPVILYAWKHGRGGWRSLGWVCVCVLISLTGLVSLMAYFHQEFGDPLVFLRGRTELWRLHPPLPFGEKLVCLLGLEPVWGMFEPGSTAYWPQRLGSATDLVFRLCLMNRLTFVAALVLTWWGWWRGLLNPCEIALTLSLIAIPYWVNGYDNDMSSMARYMTVIAPLHPIAGILLGRGGPVVGGLFAAVGAAFMAIYAALFAQGYWLW